MNRTISAASVGLVLLVASSASAATCPFVWNTDLRLGSNSADVLALQQFLNSDAATAVAASGTGSAGQESTFFGAKTKAAVTKFQEKYFNEILSPNGLTKGTGTVGPSTRATLNALCAAPGAAPAAAASTESSLTIAAGQQPAATIAPADAGDIPFTTFTLTAGGSDVEVRSVTVQRRGFAADAVFYSVALTDSDGNYIGKDRSFNSNHEAVLGESFTIPAGETESFTIVGNMNSELSEYEGQMPVLLVSAVSASVAATGPFPISGTAHVVNSTLEIGSAEATLSQYDPNGDRWQNIFDSNVRFAGIRLTAHTQEALRLESITWDQAGTASASDVANVRTVVDGIEYPAEADGRHFTSTVGVDIPKGETIDVYVIGDILPTAVNRTIKFDIRESGDVWLTGATYGFTDYVYAGGNTDVSGSSVFITSDGTTDGDEGTPFFSGSTFTVYGATVNGVGRI